MLTAADGQPQVLHDGEHILPDVAAGFACIGAKEVAGVVGDAYGDALALLPGAPQGAYGGCGAEESFGGASA